MERIEGMISDIVFKNEDNGYTIAHLANSDNEIVIVGCMPTLSVGESIEVEGKWVNHKTYGTQFEVEKFMPITPSSLEGIYVYLSSGMIHGIGEKMAKRIVDKFGVDTLNVIQNAPERLKEVEGIGSKKIDQIVKSYEENRELRNIIIELSRYGITPNYCMRIYKKYKNKAIKIINENPYKLAEDIRGIGFKIADNIANKIGIEKDSKDRVSQGILYTLNQSLGNGHTYLPKHILLQEASKLLEVKSTIIEECIISLAYDQKVHIENVNGEQLIYLIPYYLSENGVCKQIIKLSQFEFENLNIDIDEEIKYVEEENSIKLAKNQSLAVKEAIENGVVIITGGPGTGKTTTINTIIKIFENNKKEVILAAPTGRAAKRMSETSGREAKTIHRLLEMGVSDDENSFFGKGEGEPLEGDVIIIDEASMIDIMLMNSLLKAIKLGTRVIIVGDVDQLPSVGPGNVLRDLINSEFIKVVRLKEIFRQGKESMIITNAHRINNGELPYLNKKGGDFFFDNRESNEEILSTILDLVNRRLPLFNPKWDKTRDIQVLSPTRKGILGVDNLNNELQAILNPPSKNKKERNIKDIIFREGDKVMQTKNNYSLKWNRTGGYGDNEGVGVFNGDMGFIESISEESRTVTVVFDDERRIVYDNIYVEELELAYAITIHKSQGSEFKVVITPSFMGSAFLMNRNILYTGITRAKELVVVVGNQKSLKYMVDNTNSMERYSSLKERIVDIVSDDKIKEE